MKIERQIEKQIEKTNDIKMKDECTLSSCTQQDLYELGSKGLPSLFDAYNREVLAAYQTSIAPPEPDTSSPSHSVFITDSVVFEYGSYEISGNSVLFLNDVLKILKDHPEISRVLVEGFAEDTEKPDLALERAQNVKNYLVQNGIRANRLVTKGTVGAEAKSISGTALRNGEKHSVQFVVSEANDF